MVESIFEVISEAATATLTLLTTLFNSAVSLFWNTSGENIGPTFIGALVMIGVGIPLAYKAITFVLKLLKVRMK